MKYFIIGHSNCSCHLEIEVLHEIEADSDEAALEEAERWWHEQLPLHAESYSLCKKLEVKTTPKIVALAREFGKPA